MKRFDLQYFNLLFLAVMGSFSVIVVSFFPLANLPPEALLPVLRGCMAVAFSLAVLIAYDAKRTRR